jgi:hypothetical protein
MWCLPPQGDPAFVCAMEDVLEVYQRPFDAACPQVCLDEAAKQILSEVRAPLPMAPGQVARVDNEYQREGTCALFMLSEPLAGKRQVLVRDRRTAEDYAVVIRHLCDELYPTATRIVLVQDNLNTHGPHSLYATFAPDEARRLMERIEWHFTPKHGSWLNMAEIELSVLATQCLSERMGSREHLEQAVAAWEAARNAALVRVDWRFTTADARIKLKRLYPSNLLQ